MRYGEYGKIRQIMAKTSTSFKKGNEGKPPGTKHLKTRLKEQIGVSTWEQVGDWLTNEGLERYKEELGKLEGKDYIFGHNAMMEFFKPKLNRLTVDGELEHKGTVQTIVLPNGSIIPIG